MLTEFHRWANATLQNPCVVENTAYIAYEVGDEFNDIVSRDNCALGLYCDASQLICLNEKAVGESCTADKEYVYNLLQLSIRYLTTLMI